LSDCLDYSKSGMFSQDYHIQLWGLKKAAAVHLSDMGVGCNKRFDWQYKNRYDEKRTECSVLKGENGFGREDKNEQNSL